MEIQILLFIFWLLLYFSDSIKVVNFCDWITGVMSIKMSIQIKCTIVSASYCNELGHSWCHSSAYILYLMIKLHTVICSWPTNNYQYRGCSYSRISSYSEAFNKKEFKKTCFYAYHLQNIHPYHLQNIHHVIVCCPSQ